MSIRRNGSSTVRTVLLTRALHTVGVIHVSGCTRLATEVLVETGRADTAVETLPLVVTTAFALRVVIVRFRSAVTGTVGHGSAETAGITLHHETIRTTTAVLRFVIAGVAVVTLVASPLIPAGTHTLFVCLITGDGVGVSVTMFVNTAFDWTETTSWSSALDVTLSALIAVGSFVFFRAGLARMPRKPSRTLADTLLMMTIRRDSHSTAVTMPAVCAFRTSRIIHPAGCAFAAVVVFVVGTRATTTVSPCPLVLTDTYTVLMNRVRSH